MQAIDVERKNRLHANFVAALDLLDTENREPDRWEEECLSYALGAMAWLLAPARLAPGAPAGGSGFMIIHPRLIQVHQLLGRHPSQLRTKLLSQLFVPLGIAKGLFLCV